MKQSDKKMEAWMLLTRTQCKTSFYMFGRSFLQLFDGNYCSMTSVFLICAILLKTWKQNLPLKWAISDFVLPDVCQLRSSHIGNYVEAFECEIIIWPNCSKFAVECTWNGKIPQNVWNLCFFSEKVDGFFEKKLEYLNFFEILKTGKFDVECVSNGNISWKCHFRPNHEVFLAKSQKTSNVGKIRKYDNGGVFSWKKKRFNLFKSLSHKNGRSKICRW